MNSSGKISYGLRKYPLFRALLAFVVIAAALVCVLLFNVRTKPLPEIASVEPPVGAPGDIITINGQNFGDIRDMSYVEIAGARLTASSYISWSDSSIKIVLPSNVQNGLVVVGVGNVRSKPALFANEVDIPVPVPKSQEVSSRPVITALSSEKGVPGDVLVISGNNFGEVRGQSRVLFSVDYNGQIKKSEFKTTAVFMENMLAVSEFEGGYELWSNNELRIRIPDGACTGVVLVDNGKERSEPRNFTIDTSAGEKTFGAKKIYLLQYTVDVADVVATDTSTITLRCPLPAATSAQPEFEITEVVPEPVLLNYQNNLIHQITRSRNNTAKNVFSQTFVLTAYEVNTAVNAEKIGAQRYTAPFLSDLLKPDDLVPATNERVKKLAEEITGTEKNAYKKARLVYDYMCREFKISDKLRKDDAAPVDLLRTKRGDAYDFAVIYTALLRAAGIPAATDAGILIDKDLRTQPHWWSEFYVSNFGWIPVDVALGAGLEYKAWQENEADGAYYFGNLDSHHVIFSRGWNQLRPLSSDSKVVQYPRSFALQSIWEEASGNTSKYSSYWSVPAVQGVY